RCGGVQEPSKDGRVVLHNPHLKHMDSDHLYHLALATSTHDLKEMFGDLRVPSLSACILGTARRPTFGALGQKFYVLGMSPGALVYSLIRYQTAVTPSCVRLHASAQHGMGAPSMSILMHEILKLVYYADCRDVVFLRIGTSGGIGIPPGSVVVSTGAVNGALREELEMHILGELVRRPAVLDAKLANDIWTVGRKAMPELNIVSGKTMCTNDFYEGQGRLDGAFCHYTEDKKFAFLERLRSLGVVNIEMEATQFASMCHHAGVKG
ncbi:unnamed protein product, partial [Ixodes hexagonus]